MKPSLKYLGFILTILTWVVGGAYVVGRYTDQADASPTEIANLDNRVNILETSFAGVEQWHTDVIQWQQEDAEWKQDTTAQLHLISQKVGV